MQELPTSLILLRQLLEIARPYLNHIYICNVLGLGEFSATRCPGCGALLAKRKGYHAGLLNTGNDGRWVSCGEKVFVM